MLDAFDFNVDVPFNTNLHWRLEIRSLIPNLNHIINFARLKTHTKQENECC